MQDHLRNRESSIYIDSDLVKGLERDSDEVNLHASKDSYNFIERKPTKVIDINIGELKIYEALVHNEKRGEGDQQIVGKIDKEWLTHYLSVTEHDCEEQQFLFIMATRVNTTTTPPQISSL